jgi:23S rRNA pseudouridine1911/1915/1917 synthase
MRVLYEDNHLIAVNKTGSEIVQGDKTGDVPLSAIVAQWLKDKYQKPGEAFVGVIHRLDRPVSGVTFFAKTSKALERMNGLFREGAVRKTYWAIVRNCPTPAAGVCVQFLVRNAQQNKSYVSDVEKPGAKRAELAYRLVGASERYFLLEIDLMTGRHHQIRCQLAAMGCPIKGDLKYGYPRANPGGGIGLHARRVRFVHPVSGVDIDVTAPVPEAEPLWQAFGVGALE